MSRRITVTLPDSILEELDCLSSEQDKCQSELVLEAIRYYLRSYRHRQLRETLKKGYLEMAEMNLTLSEEHLTLENEAMNKLAGRKASGVS